MHAVYVSYDGALDPLGVSQVVPYLEGLSARGWSITLITFEKADRWSRPTAASIRGRLEAAGIRWRPLTYRRGQRPALALLNVVAGARAVAAEARRARPAIVHCRGDATTVMARWARVPRATRLLYDVRGHFSDERVDAGSWRRGDWVDRVVRTMEAQNLRRADAAVVLTERAAAELRRRRPSLPRLRVIPTCADVARFTARPPTQKAEFGLVYSGSLGTWYMAEEMLAFASATRRTLPGTTLFLTPHADDARRLGAASDRAETISVEPEDVPAWLRRASVMFFFIRPVPSKRASCPTKFAEGLASGLPIVCNRGIGDLDDVVESERVGILVDEFSERAYRDAARRLGDLLEDPDVGDRCRRLATARYSVEQGVSAYAALYRELCGAGAQEGRR